MLAGKEGADMKKALMLAMMVLMLMPGTAGAEGDNSASSWAETWRALSPSHKKALMLGYRMAAFDMCTEKNLPTRVQRFCDTAIDGMEGRNDEEIIRVIDFVYVNDRYKKIDLQIFILSALGIASGHMSQENFFSALNKIASSYDTNGKPVTTEEIRRYKAMVLDLLN